MVNGCWRLFQWGVILALVAALAVGIYLYIHLDDEIRHQVEQRLASHYQHLTVHVGRAQFEQDRGITIRDIQFSEPQTGSSPQSLLVIDELYLAGKIRMDELLSGSLPIEKIVVRRPRATVVRQPNGRWNVQSLMPLPKFSDASPPIAVEDATISFKDAAHPTARPLVLRGIGCELTPVATEPAATMAEGTQSRTGHNYHLVGAAAGFAGGDFRLSGDIGTKDGSLDLTISTAGLEVSPELVASLPLELPLAFDDVQITGRLGLAVHIVRPPGPASSLAWSAQAEVERGRVRYAKWPQPLTDLQCHIMADGNHLSVERMTAKCGPAEVAVSCNRNGWAADAPLALAARLTGLTLDAEMAEAIPERWAHCWQRFEPAGKVDAELRVAFDGQQWRPEIKAVCRGLSLTDTEKFPYRLEQAAGSVDYTPEKDGRPDRLAIDLTGVGNNRPVTIKAELTQVLADPPDTRPSRTGVADAPPQRVNLVGYRGTQLATTAFESHYHPVGWIVIAGSDIAVHEQLLAALDERSPSGNNFVRSLRASGTFDFRWRAEWTDRIQPRPATSLDLTLKDCSILFDRFEYPLRHVHGLVTERDRRWEIHDVEARGPSDTTIVTCQGTTTPVTAGHELGLVFQAQNVPLDDNLKQALPPGGQQAWDNLRPQGRIDFTARVTQTPTDEKPRVDVELRPRERSVSVEPLPFPLRLDQVDGVVRIVDGHVSLHDLRGVHGRLECFAKSGGWQPTEGGWHMSLSGLDVDRLDPQRELLSALPPGLQRVIERLQPSGDFAIYDSSLSFAKLPNASKMASAWDVNLDCHQVSLGGSLQINNIFGGVRLVGQSNERTSFTAGELTINSMSWKGMQFTSVHGPLWADGSVCLLGQPAGNQQKRPPQPITADAYGGSLTANVRIEHEPNPNYVIGLAIGGADLGRFAGERLGGPKELTGKTSGTLLLSNSGQSTRTLQGAGELHVVDGNIYELPVIVSLLKVLRNRAPDKTAFNRCDLKFRVLGEDILFSQLNLLGDAGSLYGEGKTNLDRKLDLVFYSLMGPADLPIPFYKTILGQASKQTLSLKVGGTWDVPVIEPKVLPGVNDALERLQTELEAGAATVTSPSAMRDVLTPRR